MPEPTDTLRERLAAATGLPALLADARATWVARAERDAAEGSDEADDDATVVATSPVKDGGSVRDADSVRVADSARDGDSVRDGDSEPGRAAPAANEARRPPARWRAFEDAFPTFYQFTNRPRN